MQYPPTQTLIASYVIQDRLEPPEGAVEVHIDLKGGAKRWCFFFTPDRMAACGDFIEGTRVGMHLGVNHMIIAAELSREIIDRVLRELDSTGRLLEHTRDVNQG